MVINLQRRYEFSLAALRGFVRSLRRRLRLGHMQFNVCIVDDESIRWMNSTFRGKNKATDVLSFPWEEVAKVKGRKARPRKRRRGAQGISNFLGDVVISVQTASRNAAAEGHSTLNEMRWLILHGVLHLLGYDHEHDDGEMTALELKLREELGVSGGKQEMQVKLRKAKVKTQKWSRWRR